jgi:hypothetical protein
MKARRRFEILMFWVLAVVVASGLWQMYGLWLVGGGSNDA